MAITGIGGIFFRSQDPEALTAWYQEQLGINGFEWTQQAGQTVFAPFPQDTDYFGNTNQQFMLNFRVDDLGAMMDRLKNNTVTIVKEIETQAGVGRFASIEDPEGNRIELWEPETVAQV